MYNPVVGLSLRNIFDMGRVTEKALRPRQYVFEGVPRERRAAFARRIREIRIAEERETQEARKAAAERARQAARGHALEIINRSQETERLLADVKSSDSAPKGDAGINAKTTGDPENKELAELQAELNMLLTERTRLYDLLGKAVQDRRRQAMGLGAREPSEEGEPPQPHIDKNTADVEPVKARTTSADNLINDQESMPPPPGPQTSRTSN